MKRLCLLACLFAMPAFATPAFAQAPPQFSAEDYQAALVELGAQNAMLSNRLVDQAISLSRAKREAADLAAKLKDAELTAKLKAETPAAPAAPN